MQLEHIIRNLTFFVLYFCLFYIISGHLELTAKKYVFITMPKLVTLYLTREQGNKINQNFENILSFCLEDILWISSIYGKIILWELNLYFIIHLYNYKNDLSLKYQSRSYTDTVKLMREIVVRIQMEELCELCPQITKH